MSRGHSKSMFIEEGKGMVGWGEGHGKANKNEQGEEVLACMYVGFLKKRMLRFLK